MALLLLVMTLLFGLLFYAIHTWQRQEIVQQAHHQAEAVAHTMVASLKTLMLSGEAESVHDWLSRMRAHPELQSVDVLRRNGALAFRDLDTLKQVNHFLGSALFSRDPLPSKRIQGISDDDLARAVAGAQVVLHDDDSNQLTLLEPIKVEQACLQCHGYEHKATRGLLLVTTSTAAAKATMWRTDRALLLMALVGIVLMSLLIVVMYRYMEAVIRALGGMLFVTDRDGMIRVVNDQACRILGREKGSLVGKPMRALLAPGHTGADFSQVCEGVEAVLLGDGGRQVPVSVLSAKMPIGSGLEGADMVHVLRDLSLQKESEREMRLAATVMDTVPSAIMVADHNAEIRLVNPAFTAITGYGVDEVLGQNPRLLKSGRQSAEFYAGMWKQIRETGRWEGEIWNRRKNGEVYPEWLIINTMKGEDGAISYYVSTFLDISEQKRLEDQLRHSASHDVLTGLPNRMLLHDRLNLGLSRAHRDHAKMGVMFIDIDGFKPVNDTHGHDVGDALLVEISSRLRDCVRGSDTVARVGGDEFVLVVEGDSQQDVLAVANKVLKLMQEPFVLDSVACQVGASIGIALYPDGGDDPELLLKKADAAMYIAKKSGKNRVSLFNDSDGIDI